MKRRSIAARVLTVILSVCMVFTMCPFVSDGWNNSGHVEAAEKNVTYTWPGNVKELKKSGGDGRWGDNVPGHYNSCHYGLDFTFTVKKVNVVAAADGKVILSGWKAGYGNTVLIKHANKQITLYGHLTGTSVKKGKRVTRGQKIGYVKRGQSTGYVFGTCMHFGIYKSKKLMNKEGSYKASKISYNPEKLLIKKNCSSHAWYKNEKYLGACVHGCKTLYSDVDGFNKFSSGKKYAYISATAIREYPAEKGKISKNNSSVTGAANIVGEKGSWYKVKVKNKSDYSYGYVLKTSIREDNGPSTLKISNVSNFSMKEGEQRTINGTIQSNYEITSIKAELGSKSKVINRADFGTGKKTVTLANSAINKSLKCEDLEAGIYPLKITAWDLSGKSVYVTATISVICDLKAPKFSVIKDTASGKEITITQKESGATLWYKVGDQEWKCNDSAVSDEASTNKVGVVENTLRSMGLRSNENDTFTLPEPISEEGTTKVTIYSAKDGKESAWISRDISIIKLDAPSFKENQIGDTICVNLVAQSGATIMYREGDSGNYRIYDGSSIDLNQGDKISYYATRTGCMDSSVEEYIAAPDEPDTPEIMLCNSERTVPVGGTVTIGWSEDSSAQKYIATLYNASDNTVVEEKKIVTPSVNFTLNEAGDYYATVVAVNGIGESDVSEALNVFARDKLTVIFRDMETTKKADIEDGAEEENTGGEELLRLTVPYGEKIKDIIEDVDNLSIKNPSRRGYVFEGWKNKNTGNISLNEYLQTPIKEDTTYVAHYEKKKYEVKYYAPDGKLIDTREIEFEEDAIDEGIENAVKEYIGDDAMTGKVIKGWSVINVVDSSSKVDVHSVDSDMSIQAVVEWGNPDLPVIIQINGVRTELDEEGAGVLFKPVVKMTTTDAKRTEIYLVATLKGSDENGVEKAIYSDRRVFSIPKGESGLSLNATENAHDFDLQVTEISDAESVTKLELVALEKKNNSTTGSTYSEIATYDVSFDYGFTAPSEWSTTKPEAVEGRIIESKTQYSYRDKDIKYSGYETMAGYTKESTETISRTVGNWQNGSATPSDTRNASYREQVTVSNKTAYKLFAKICQCGKFAYSTKSGYCSSCKTYTITDRKLKVFTSLPINQLGGTLKPDAAGKNNGDGGYKFPKTVTTGQGINGKGTVYFITYGHSTIQTLTSYTSKNSDGCLYLWSDPDEPTVTVSQKTTTKTRNKFYQWGQWSNEKDGLDPEAEGSWSDTPISKTSTRDVRERVLYRYSDKIQTPAETRPATGEVRTFKGNLNDVEEDLNGKHATVMVYQVNNTDPNKYQMQYTGQIILRSDESDENIGKNYYEFSFIPREEPSFDTGNYVVTLGVEGTTGLVRIAVIDAPKVEHTVKFVDVVEGEQVILSEQKVPHGEDADMTKVEIPEKEGYIFTGWSRRTTNITSDCEGDNAIEARYVPMKNAIVFIDWINQTVDLLTAETGKEITLPVIDGPEEEDGAYLFKGWKKEDGTSVGETLTVTGNTILIADYDTAEFTVNFHDADGEIIDTQMVEYHKAATPPKYTGDTKGGEFVSWSTESNWWSVEESVDVWPVIAYSEHALAPTAEVITDETTETRSLGLETKEENADIYFTTDGTIPTDDLIREYLNTESSNYKGSIQKYTAPITFSELEDGEETKAAMDITAVSYVAGKNVSEECNVTFEKSPDGESFADDDANETDWTEIGEYRVKASAGKAVEISVELEDNPGIASYDFMIESEGGTFYVDADEYDGPTVSGGTLSESGSIVAEELTKGWRVKWNATDASVGTGKMFTMTLHAGEDIEAGMYPITVSYSKEGTCNEKLEPVALNTVNVVIDSEASININTFEATLSRYSYVYEGEAIEPVVRIEGLREGDDFTVEYENNVNIGTAKAVITGIGDYTGTVEKEFTITPVNIANADIAPIGDQVKTGSAIEPEMDITYNGTTLIRDTDYEATFTDNVEVGTAGVEIRGIGNFKGITDAQFNIIETTESRLEAAEAAVAELEQQLADMETEKETLEQRLTQAQNSYDTLLEEKNGLETQLAELQTEKTALEQREAELLQQKAELEENAQENQQALAEIQNELDEITEQKDQLETDLQNAQNEKDAIEQQLTQAQTTVNDLTAQKEALETRNTGLQTELDEAQAEIARLQKALKESKVDSLDEVKVSGIKNRVYTGSALQQKLTVTVGGKTLVNGTDYTVAYKNNKNVGKATVTISGQNEYRGTFSRTFKINPKGTSISKLVRGKKMMTVKWKKQAVQTTGYQIRYSLKKSFKSGVKTVTVKGPKTTKKVVKKLKAKKTYYVQVRTYKTVSGKKYYSAWSKTKYVKTK